MPVATVGIGSNLDEPAANCRQAVCLLQQAKDFHVLQVSSLYRTEPVGGPLQPWFVNGVVRIQTALGPTEVLKALKSIEAHMGRAPAVRWGPRLVDLDLLLYGDCVYEGGGLQVPHPRLTERRFVLIPLLEVDPDGKHPETGVPFAAYLAALGTAQQVEKLREDAACGI
ncbi:MAG: 2-amino-4-hydroxy-6-hydroxymethyldihydropteridine diphosphokinase [Candidatus Tectomicrobia bacterium]|uniref:2-amino-4-hydroxy-6-hydroxymethyldihydropteridine pyrophosphokinase n=1 Tax=Tectimicrobiota bacterium TaxID=2528274 RepID=A0A932GQM8_UNCTE|nr:2-amino-4-hydroxy-6-hydroxymethyldihydropteridine diphosphokinase [Candidatus Tectomicrobia bacterium]